MESAASTGHIRNCYFQVLFKSLQNVVLWAEIAYNQHLSHSDFSLVLKVSAELGDLLLNTVKRKISSFFLSLSDLFFLAALQLNWLWFERSNLAGK